MKEREIAKSVEKRPYFEEVATPPVPEQDDGTREMGELYPFLISGGTNTERYYFIHINDKTEYKFNIKPKYFNDESNYTEAFPKRINEILNVNNDVKIFCVFDWDTIRGNKTKLEKHEAFEKQFQAEISNGTVTLCPSMPSIEYWFLLHFKNYTKLLKNYREVSNVLAPHLRQCFGNPQVRLKKLLKNEENLKDAMWVEKLCANGKLALAIERAENNINTAVTAGEIESQSYSYVYKVFKKHNVQYRAICSFTNIKRIFLDKLYRKLKSLKHLFLQVISALSYYR